MIRPLATALLLLIAAPASSETVDVKYRGVVDLKPFACTDTPRSSFIQRVCYDKGQSYMLISRRGTDIGATAITAPVRFVQKLLGSVTGAGIKRNIADCYEFIVNHYQPGDRIYLFGFSRGAYTVRSLANLLMLCGIPTKTPGGPVMRFRKAV